MPKTATIAIRVDEDLKARAQETFADMGLPMSLAVDMFLRQVVERGELPFPIAAENAEVREAGERDRRERDFWSEFTVWCFRAWPRFDSLDTERRARELGWDGAGAGEVARDFVCGESDRGSMTPEQRAAYDDLRAMRTLLLDAKELMYSALGMDKTFVPSLSAAYGDKADAWRLRYVRERKGDPPSGDVRA